MRGNVVRQEETSTRLGIPTNTYPHNSREGKQLPSREFPLDILYAFWAGILCIPKNAKKNAPGAQKEFARRAGGPGLYILEFF